MFKCIFMLPEKIVDEKFGLALEYGKSAYVDHPNSRQTDHPKLSCFSCTKKVVSDC